MDKLNAIDEEVRASYQGLAEKLKERSYIANLPKYKDRAAAIAAAELMLQSLLHLQPAQDEVKQAEDAETELRTELAPLEDKLTKLESLNKKVLRENPVDYLALTFCGVVPMLQTFLMLNYLLGVPVLASGIIAFVGVFILFNWIGGGLREAYAREIEFEALLDERYDPLSKADDSQSLQIARRRLARADRRQAARVKKEEIHPRLRQLRTDARWILIRLCIVDLAVGLGFPAVTASLVPGFEYDFLTVGLAFLSLGFDWAASAVIRQQVNTARPDLLRRAKALQLTIDGNHNADLASLRAECVRRLKQISRAREKTSETRAVVQRIWREIISSRDMLNHYQGKIEAALTALEAAKLEHEGKGKLNPPRPTDIGSARSLSSRNSRGRNSSRRRS